MDAGDILGVRKVKIEDSDTCGSMFNKLSLVGRDLLLETIDKLVEGKITPIKQNENEATFAYNVTKEEELIDLMKKPLLMYLIMYVHIILIPLLICY